MADRMPEDSIGRCGGADVHGYGSKGVGEYGCKGIRYEPSELAPFIGILDHGNNLSDQIFITLIKLLVLFLWHISKF